MGHETRYRYQSLRRAPVNGMEEKPAGALDDGRRMFAAVAVLVALAIVVLNLHAPAEPTPLQRLLASLLVALCAAPSLMWAARRPWRHSAMPYVGVLYAACFAAPVFVRVDFFGAWLPRPLLEADAIDYALLLAFGGWAALMAGYFAFAGGKPWAALPTVRILPSDDPKLAKAVAVVVGLVAAPFFYLDKAAVAARYAGETLLPDAVAFPVTLAGQFVLFAALVCFHLHLRGQLGVAGRLYLAALVAYYTVLGFSTGMVNHGAKAVFALFVAYAVVAPRPTWRGIAWGAAVAAALLCVLIPTRLEYRQLIWTHGVGPNMTSPVAAHQFVLADGDEQTWTTPAYEATLRGRTLTVAHNDPEVCRQPAFRIGAFVDPVDVHDLPELRWRRSFQSLGTSFGDGLVEDGRCVASLRLPDYPIVAVRIELTWLKQVVPHEVDADAPSRAVTPSNPGAPQAHHSLAEKAGLYAKTMAAAFDGEGGAMRAEDLTAKRLDYLLPLAWLTVRTPDPLPFLRGETFLPILYKLVPRAVFAEKPGDVRDLGIRYGFTAQDTMRAFKVHQLGEFYVNFGLAGVLLGMAALGLLYRALHELLHHPDACTATLAAGTQMLAVLALEMESALTLSLGFLMWYAIALAVLALAVHVLSSVAALGTRFS